MSVMKVYNGTSWVYPFFRYPKVYTGSEWYQARPSVRTASSWGGESSDTLNLTVGYGQIAVMYVYSANYWGYGPAVDNPAGSLSKSKTKVADDATVRNLYWEEYTPVSGSTTYSIVFSIYSPEGIPYENEGWSTITIGSNTYNRTDASFSTSSTGAHWTWAITTGSNPFGTSTGVAKTITWA